MRREPQYVRIAAGAVTSLLIPLAMGWTQKEPASGFGNEVEYHERMLQQRKADAIRAEVVRKRTSDEIAEVERTSGQEKDPKKQERLQARLETLRLTMLRRNILQQRAELKQLELMEYVAILKEETVRGTPLPPEQNRQKRRDFFARRLNRAENLLQMLITSGNAATSDREKGNISRLVRRQEELIADIKRNIATLNGQE